MLLPVQNSPIGLHGSLQWIRGHFLISSSISLFFEDHCCVSSCYWDECGTLPRCIRLENKIQIPYTNCNHSWPHNFLFSFIKL